MGNKVAKPVHPGGFPNPFCLLWPAGFCWLCTYYTDPNNKWTDDCPKPPEGVQLSSSNAEHLFIPAGHLEYEGTVYNVELGVCVDNGGTWVIEPAPGGCDISKDALVSIDLSTAVVDNMVARDFPPGLSAAGNSDHERFINDMGFLAVVLCALCLIMWAGGIVRSIKLNQPAQMHEDDVGYSLSGGFADNDCKEKDNMVSEDCNKRIEGVDVVLWHGQSQLENN